MTDITRINSTPEEQGEPKKNKGGRPRMQLDEEQIRKLAKLQCSNVEIAYIMGCHRDTIHRNYKHIVDLGKAEGKITLRRAMFRNATENHHAAVQIFLAKNLLGMSDTPTASDDDMILPWDSDDKEP